MPKRYRKIYIEISNVCNLQCTFCPEVERGKRFMPPDLFKRVATQAAPLTDEVCFHLMGEPLLHPEFETYLEMCREINLRVNLTTNGVLLDAKRQALLLNPILSQVNFSLQSFGDNFPERDHTDYLQRIFSYTERAHHERPDLYINYRLWNDGSIGAQKTNEKIFEQIRLNLNPDFNPVLDVRRKKSGHIKGRVYVHFDSRFEWPHPHQPFRSTTGFCHGLSTHMGILADGTVVPCCLDKEGRIDLGNCASKTLGQIIQTPRAQNIRNGFKKGQLVEDLCQRCTFIKRFDTKAKRITSSESHSVSRVEASS